MDGWLELLGGIKVASDWTVNFIHIVLTEHFQLKFIVEDVIQPLQASPGQASILLWIYYGMGVVLWAFKFSGRMSLLLKKKREDLQGIRGVAIISVILFHFLPSIFPNGYIGVDEFFVLSGYLMCQLLINQKKKKKKKNKESSDIFIFYIRRLKRILPLYFLILFLSIISIFTLFPFESIHLNVISAKNAALFISNRPKTQDEDYFQMLTSAMDVFTHTWSLSVEVQFYVIVPFLFLIGNRISDYSNRLEILFHLILGMITFLLSELQTKPGDLEEGEKADLLEEMEDDE
uniref:Acyl_transf_3 domain-containing protein n=1 Tax=Caenorhabditis tropicalis TaxID=1561998 RepID=A0A1I7UI19_9PELO